MAKFTSKRTNIYDEYLGMSSMYQNMSSWMPVLKSWQFPQQSLSLLIFDSNGNNNIINSLADAWLHFVSFLEKVFQLFL